MKYDKFRHVSEKKYGGLMGMCEMEGAVSVLEQLAEYRKTTIDKLRVGWQEFYEAGEMVGFCQLLARGYLMPDYPNSEFIPGNELIDRLNKAWGLSLPYAKRKWELLKEGGLWNPKLTQ